MGDYTSRTSRAYTDDDGMLSHTYTWPKYPTLTEDQLPKPAMSDTVAELEEAMAEEESNTSLEPRTKTGGRKPGTPNKFARIDIMKAARIYSLQALGTLVDIMKDEKQPGAVRVAAANSVLDRAHGKAKQVTEIGGIDGGDIQTKLTIEFVGTANASIKGAVQQTITQEDGRVIDMGAAPIVQPNQAPRPWEK
jgi:hypothetical protein